MVEKMKKQIYIIGITIIAMITICIASTIATPKTVETNSSAESNKKIEWGIKRNKEHEQPDVGSANREVLEKYEGICLGNEEKKEVVITFDEGYEAGYTPQILDTLKANDVKATFFITAHYVNTASDLVQRMINEGHIVGNHIPKFLMTLNYKIIKC